MTRPVFELAFTALNEHIDQLGHVNNAVWVRWIQDVATAHWDCTARKLDKDRYYWVVVRHEIDYLRPAREGERIIARTWVGEAPRGARFDRFVEFVGADQSIRVRSHTWWAMIDQALQRPARIRLEVIAPFISQV